MVDSYSAALKELAAHVESQSGSGSGSSSQLKALAEAAALANAYQNQMLAAKEFYPHQLMSQVNMMTSPYVAMVEQLRNLERLKAYTELSSSTNPSAFMSQYQMLYAYNNMITGWLQAQTTQSLTNNGTSSQVPPGPPPPYPYHSLPHIYKQPSSSTTSTSRLSESTKTTSIYNNQVTKSSYHLSKRSQETCRKRSHTGGKDKTQTRMVSTSSLSMPAEPPAYKDSYINAVSNGKESREHITSEFTPKAHKVSMNKDDMSDDAAAADKMDYMHYLKLCTQTELKEILIRKLSTRPHSHSGYLELSNQHKFQTKPKKRSSKPTVQPKETRRSRRINPYDTSKHSSQSESHSCSSNSDDLIDNFSNNTETHSEPEPEVQVAGKEKLAPSFAKDFHDLVFKETFLKDPSYDIQLHEDNQQANQWPGMTMLLSKAETQ